MHFPPLDGKKNPTTAMNLRMIGKIYKHDDRLTQFASMTSKTNLRSNQSNDLYFPRFAFNLS